MHAPAVPLATIACTLLITASAYVLWVEHTGANDMARKLCFYSPAMLLPWIPALCVLIFVAWSPRA